MSRPFEIDVCCQMAEMRTIAHPSARAWGMPDDTLIKKTVRHKRVRFVIVIIAKAIDRRGWSHGGLSLKDACRAYPMLGKRLIME